ncbi:class F sortase [Saccharomonospora piscinae]|uniref:sortase domain-containing protein n=1 Tax=Saccharomonospora piscinae TaxID=687388 RepID=UPI001107303F|nr:sortase [Saccharomonospora piscinae]TLW92253.1 class F sortase [Saccharomonospora piscinae]
MVLTLGSRHSEPRRIGVAAAAVVTVATLTAAVVGTTLLRPHLSGEADPLGPAAEPGPPSTAPHTLAAGAAPLAHEALPSSSPVRVRIPALGVDTESIARLGRTPSGAAEIPGHLSTVGWLDSTPAPGRAGASVLMGHTQVSYERGVFYALGSLRPGDTVHVARSDGSEAVFTVFRVEEVDQSDALGHAQRVTHAPDLRLLTTAGEFDHQGDDPAVMVSARLTATT